MSILLLNLGFICSCLSSFLRWKRRSLIWELSFFSTTGTEGYNPPLDTSPFEILCFYFRSIQNTFRFPLWLCLWPMGHVEMCYLCSRLSFWNRFQFNAIEVRKHTCMNPFTFRDLLYGSACGLSWQVCCEHLRRACLLLFWVECL